MLQNPKTYNLAHYRPVEVSALSDTLSFEENNPRALHNDKPLWLRRLIRWTAGKLFRLLYLMGYGRYPEIKNIEIRTVTIHEQAMTTLIFRAASAYSEQHGKYPSAVILGNQQMSELLSDPVVRETVLVSAPVCMRNGRYELHGMTIIVSPFADSVIPIGQEAVEQIR